MQLGYRTDRRDADIDFAAQHSTASTLHVATSNVQLHQWAACRIGHQQLVELGADEVADRAQMEPAS